ncbi:hypothetical protein [Pseudomonas moraviensis]|uniref:Uncharacterized protein n=1 Tax=Pseudomonas moraviensis R28-S TaxID=1395516 RepID=V8R6Y8_9PSED|nr:hypothetical protein [Pseudomonas moraviensis]ETF07024.1 hypothetical protein PMO01_17295 [Pseudomonas moraviensis R28-S]
MKSEYRQAVESVIAQESKLAEVRHMHAEARARLETTTEWLAVNEKTLAEYEGRVAQIESDLFVKP